jgi:hypothetical protein
MLNGDDFMTPKGIKMRKEVAQLMEEVEPEVRRL